MTAPDPDRSAAAAGFLAAAPPRRDHGWDDRAMSAYEAGCAALVALGEAEETAWGAAAYETLQRPDPLPRHDDICVVVLNAAAQAGRLSWRQAECVVPPPRNAGGMAQFLVAPHGTRPPPSWPPSPPPNIRAAHDLGCAWAEADMAPVLVALVLVALGLVDAEGAWTARAEPVLRRIQPRVRAMDPAADPRLIAATEAASRTMPDDLRAEAAQLLRIAEEDVVAAMHAQEARADAIARRFGQAPHMGPSVPRERMIASLRALRRNALDRIFFHRRRFAGGWLGEDQAARALGCRDPLAVQMRRAVMARLHPETPFAAE